MGCLHTNASGWPAIGRTPVGKKLVFCLSHWQSESLIGQINVMAYLFRFYLLGCCSLNVFKEFSGNPSSFENVFKGLFLTLFSYQGSCRYRPASATHLVYHTFQCLSTVFLFFFSALRFFTTARWQPIYISKLSFVCQYLFWVFYHLSVINLNCCNYLFFISI